MNPIDSSINRIDDLKKAMRNDQAGGETQEVYAEAGNINQPHYANDLGDQSTGATSGMSGVYGRYVSPVMSSNTVVTGRDFVSRNIGWIGGLALAGVGIWLLRRYYPEQMDLTQVRGRVSNMTGNLAGRVSGVASTVGTRMSGVTGTMTDKVSGVTGLVADKLNTIVHGQQGTQGDQTAGTSADQAQTGPLSPS